MINKRTFIEIKEYKRFTEFCDACIRYKYIGICYGAPGVGKTLSSRYYSDWDRISQQINYRKQGEIAKTATEEVLMAKTVFYTAPAERATRIGLDIGSLSYRLQMTKSMYLVKKDLQEEESVYANFSEYNGIDLVIIDEIDRLKLQHLEQLRSIYDQNNLAMIFIGMPGIEKRLSRYPQLYSRIGFAHEFDRP
jgi:DNA transposition AAA+ family ATPase